MSAVERRVWKDRSSFERERPARGEAYGVSVAELADPYGGPTHRVRWYETTGEVVTSAIALPGQGPVVLIGQAADMPAAQALVEGCGDAGVAWTAAGVWPSSHRGLGRLRWCWRVRRDRRRIRRARERPHAG